MTPLDTGKSDLLTLVGAIEVCEAQPHDQRLYASLAALLESGGASREALLVRQMASIWEGFPSDRVQPTSDGRPTSSQNDKAVSFAELAGKDFGRAIAGAKLRPLVSPGSAPASEGVKGRDDSEGLQSVVSPGSVTVDDLASVVGGLHDALSAHASIDMQPILDDMLVAVETELHKKDGRRESESVASLVAWFVHGRLQQWFDDVRGWALPPFGSGTLLRAIAQASKAGLRPYFRAVPDLVHDSHSLLALARIWTRDVEDEFESLEVASVLLAQTVEPNLRGDFVEELGSFRLLRAVATLHAIEDARHAEVDRILLFRVRDAYLDAQQPQWAIAIQKRICDTWPDKVDEHIVLGETALAAKNQAVAEQAFTRALKLRPRHGGAAARLKKIASGQLPNVESRGFGTRAEISSFRSLLKDQPERQAILFDRLVETAEALLDVSTLVTEKIIKASDHHWYDIAYYASLDKIDGLMGRQKRVIRTIALYYWRLHDGGTERVTSRLATVWKSLGYRVLLLTDEQPNEIDYDCGPGIERFVLPPHRQRFVMRGKALAKLLREENVDVFVTNLWVETTTAWDLFVAKSINIPVIVGWHNVFDAGIYSGYDIQFFQQRIAAYRYADLVVALSAMDQYWFLVQGIQSRVIHNPLTFQSMPETVSPLSSKFILWMGRVERHQKRIEHVIRMLPLVLQKVSDATLIVVGDGPDKVLAEQLAAALGVAGRIKFVGYSSRVEEYIQQAAVHVMTSEFEGSPMVISETWSHGVPTVMYDLSYLELLRVGKGFISVEQNDYEALAESVAQVLLDDGLRARLGKEARATAQAFFDIDVAKQWKRIFDDLPIKDNMSIPLSPQDVASVAPLLIRHLADRMYAVDAKAERDLQAVQLSAAPAPAREDAVHRSVGRAAKKVLSLGKAVRDEVTRKAIVLGANAFDKRPSTGFSKLKTIDFGHIGLGDNLMAWVGLHALVSNGFHVVSPGCLMYVPNDLTALASAIFSRYDVLVKGVAPHTRSDLRSPVFSPLPPETPWEWYKTYIGVDWRMNCFEALDTQKTIPRSNASYDPRSRFRLGLSERILYRRQGWQSAGADYVGYRVWLPIARKLGLVPLTYLALVKRTLMVLRTDIAGYIEERSAGREPGPDMALFPAGKSFQAFSPAACKTLRERLPQKGTQFYIQGDDPWITKYRAAGIEARGLESIEDLFWIVKSSRRVMTTDSFSSHVAQLLRDDFVLALTRDFHENIVHPGAHPLIVANHPPCAPCNYFSRGKTKECVAGFSNCIAFDSPSFVDNIAKAMLAFSKPVETYDLRERDRTDLRTLLNDDAHAL
jgi:glycosyltransferase involved in cell wall biosynthesis